MSNSPSPVFIKVGTGAHVRSIATLIRSADSQKPALIWLPGYRSDMQSTKATALYELADKHDLPYIRFDYSGHGLSGGDFKDGTISRWLEETLAVVQQAGFARLILVGSSMGGWIALRLAQELRKIQSEQQAIGMVLISPAPDFTVDLIEPHLTSEERDALEQKGYFTENSEYSSEPNIFTKALLDDGHANRVLTGIIETSCPVHILHGMQDTAVPYHHALKLMEHLPSDNVVLSLIRDGEHRLARIQDLQMMTSAVEAMLNQ